MTGTDSPSFRTKGWNGRAWRIWLICMFILCISQFLHTGGFASRVTTEKFVFDGRVYQGLLFSPAGPLKELVLAAHGTNSHREIFMPLAWECTQRGISLFTFDSPTVTTDEGVEIRSRELETALNSLGAGRSKPLPFHMAGHSDGVPPSLALAGRRHGDEFRSVSILGSFATPDMARIATVSAFAGTLDQVFPVSEIRASLDEHSGSNVPLHLSRLSDHFTEQYDPLLITSIANTISGARSSPIGAARRLLRLALLAVLAFLGGSRAAGRGFLFRACFVGSMLAFCYLGDRLEWPRGPAVLALLGMLAGPFSGGTVLRFIAVFWGLMALNVAAASAWFRSHISEDVLWLPLMMFWYLPAWIVKLTLFLASLVRRADPFGLDTVPTPLLVLAAAALVVPDLPGLVRKRFGAAATMPPAGRSRTLAIVLVSIMAGLWGIRFFQGFVRLEILESMAGTWLRTLLLPAGWLVWKSISALRASSGNGPVEELSPDEKIAK